MAKKGAWVDIVLKTGGVIAFVAVLGALKQAPLPTQQVSAASQQTYQVQPSSAANYDNSLNGYYQYQSANSYANPRGFQTRAS
ncbi:MAG: hypothetical protein M0Z55_11070 [Peptococcaceae bacterium]|nr:hypothetical protein [Peptococcaceae bacterium]